MPRVEPKMSLADYHAEKEHLSKTGLKHILPPSPPAIFKAWRDGTLKDEENADMRVGAAAHMYINEFDLFCQSYHISPDKVRRAADEKPWKEQVKLAAGREIIKAKEANKVISIGKSLSADPRGKILLAGNTQIEVSLFFEDPEFGYKLKCRPDIFRDDDVFVDIKVTDSAQPEVFTKTAERLGYDLSVALAVRGFEQCFGRKLAGYIFLVIEKDPPNLVEAFDALAPFQGDLTYATVGEYRLRQALQTINKCEKSGKWPGYTNGIQPMKMSDWMLRSLEGFE